MCATLNAACTAPTKATCLLWSLKVQYLHSHPVLRELHIHIYKQLYIPYFTSLLCWKLALLHPLVSRPFL